MSKTVNTMPWHIRHVAKGSGAIHIIGDYTRAEDGAQFFEGQTLRGKQAEDFLVKGYKYDNERLFQYFEYEPRPDVDFCVHSCPACAPDDNTKRSERRSSKVELSGYISEFNSNGEIMDF